MRRVAVLMVALGSLAGCGEGESAVREEGGVPAVSDPVPDSRPKPAPYRAPSSEPYAAGKQVAARAAQDALTYARGATARQVAKRVDGEGGRQLARVLAPAVDSRMRSAGTVVYPQLSGLTESSMGVMVVVKQRLQDEQGRWTSVSRVLDVRLVRAAGESWALESVYSVGGSAVPEPARLGAAARAVLDDPAISLPDSARWDIHRGGVATELLTALSRAAEQAPIGVTVLDSGHPPNVWETATPSAHSAGLAADIWSVDGKPVGEQAAEGSTAFELAASFVRGGAVQVGSPWVFPPGGATSFTDEVHRDHVHLQQSAG